MIVTLEKNKQTAQTTVVMPKNAVSIASPPFLLAGKPVVCYGLILIPVFVIVNTGIIDFILFMQFALLHI